MTEHFFDDYPEFIELDSRVNRKHHGPVTAESMSKRHEAMMPETLVTGKTVLDLGCWMGASGHWALAHGASHYTGVEIQPSLVETGQRLLSKYWTANQFTLEQKDIEVYLDECILNGKTFDIVVLIGVVQCYLNFYEFLTKVTKVTTDIVIIDNAYSRIRFATSGNFVEIDSRQHCTSGDQYYTGAGIAISPGALNIVMDTLGFVSPEGLIVPTRIDDRDINDAYSDHYPLIDYSVNYNYEFKKFLPNRLKGWVPSAPIRYLIRYQRYVKSVDTLSETVKNNTLRPEPIDESLINYKQQWEFDEKVAVCFQDEAERHIPDYHRVVELTCELIDVSFDSKDIDIIDVGSALGYTVNYLKNYGYTNVRGVEKSEDMIRHSLHNKLIYHSDQFPASDYDVVIANWTLHFIEDKESYLREIYRNLRPGGMLILTDKMTYTDTSEKLYHNFKRKRGVSEEIIEQKKQALEGVLTCKPLHWYMSTLTSLGFNEVELVNSSYMFNTVYAKK